MAPVELLDLRAVFSNGRVRMTWKYPQSPPDTVHIFPCMGGQANPQLSMHGHIEKRLMDCPDGITFDVVSGKGSDVRKMEYCVFLADRNEPPPGPRAFENLHKCFIGVISGEARVSYDIKREELKKRPWDRTLTQYTIWIKSSAEIEAGLLGYSYYFGDKEIALAFPGTIPAGITEYPPTFIPYGAEPAVAIIGGGNADVSIIQQPLSFWTKLFKSKKYLG